MAKGDHFFVWRTHKGVPFQHHAIDMGDSTAVHFTDGNGGVAQPGASNADFVVARTPITSVTRDGRDEIHVVQHSDQLPADVVVQRAASRIGDKGYHLVFDNCEHFACWCVLDESQSRQVQVAFERLAAMGVKSMFAGGARMASGVVAKRLTRGMSPLMLLADVAQWGTEIGGHHVGLTNPKQRKQAGRAVGGATALACGALGGPIGILVAGGLWAVGEVASEASHKAYENARQTSTS